MIRLICIMVLLALDLAATPPLLGDASGSVNLVPFSRYLLDEQERYTPETILDHLEDFRPAEKAIYNFGFVERPLWIYFEVTASKQLFEPWILRIDNPQIDFYELYRRDGNSLTLLHSDGDTQRCNRFYDCRTFWEPLHADTAGSAYLLYIKTKGSLQVPLSVEALQQANRDEAFANLLFGLYYGILLLLLVYNLVLFIVVKEIHYINYLLFLGAYMLFQLSFDGVGREWLWPNSIWMVNSGLSVFIFLSGMLAFRFARYFLMLKLYAPMTERIVVAAELVSFAGVLFSLVSDYHFSIKVAAVWSAVVPWILIYAGFKVLKQYRAARYYVVGWIVFLLATILVALNKLGLLPAHPVSLHMQQIGSLIQMILLSFALADRINMMKKEHLQKLRDFNAELKEKIARKVEELRRKDSLMLQQSRQAAMGEMIENIAHQWRQPLNQLSLVQSNLFFDYTLGRLDKNKMENYQEQAESLMRYMTQTIDDFRNFFQPDRERTTFNLCENLYKTVELLLPSLRGCHIETEIGCDPRLELFGHENEFSQALINLVSNAKDAMKEHRIAEPRIRILAEALEESIAIRVCDNGGGIEPALIDKIFDPYFTTKFQSQGTGIGLYMVKTIVEKSMGGSIDVENDSDGACFTMTIPKKNSRERIKRVP